MAKIQKVSSETKQEENFASFHHPYITPAPPAVLRALEHSLDWSELPEPSEMAGLEKDGYQVVETGFTTHKNGGCKVAVLTDMPQVKPAMWDWWFGWHGCSDHRYRLWHPSAHISAHWEDGGDHTCYIGRNSIIKEYIGDHLLEAAIQFKSPIEFGFSIQSIQQKDEAVYICAQLGHPRLPVNYGFLVHQIRKTAHGAEMRSRFWVGGPYVSLRKKGKAAEAFVAVLKKVKSLPPRFAEHLLRHCSEEMNHLAAFLPALYQQYHSDAGLHISGPVHQSTDPHFEKTMFGFLFNQQHFGRTPDMILEPRTVEDVINIVRYARQSGQKISILSGGHSFSANAMRPHCITLSMKHFQQYSIDREAMTATAEPGVGGSVLMKALYQKELFFPAGHCTGVCLGGYLLQGGYGWNGRKLGIACKSVLALDIVTADGRLIHASPTENSDMYWAARGAGPGFFGVVVKFYLQLYPKPKYQAIIAHDFSIKHLEQVYRWAYETGPDIPKAVEFQMLMSRNMLNALGPGIEAFAPIFADTKDEFDAAKQFMDNSPIKKLAMIRTPAFNPGIHLFYKAAMTHYPSDYHYGVDNMWTHASIDDLMPHIKTIAETMPPAPTHFLWLNWYPDPLDTDMAYSKEDNIYLALYSCWKHAKDTPLYGNWASDMVRRMQAHSSGIQLADEGLHLRPDRFLSEAHFKKLQAIRKQRDPERLFVQWHHHE